MTNFTKLFGVISGLEAKHVTKIVATPHAVTATVLKRNDEGRFYVGEDGEVATEVISLPLDPTPAPTPRDSPSGTFSEEGSPIYESTAIALADWELWEKK